MECKIKKITAREVIDSRGFPTVESTVTLDSGVSASAIVPSGASTGEYEAVELRDKGDRYGGKGVLTAVNNVNSIIAPALTSHCVIDQMGADSLMLTLDNTDNKSKLGANAVLSVSLAIARAAAMHLNMPLYRYLGGVYAHTMPVPMMNILNGGAHASNNIDIQEFMIMPVGAKSFGEALRCCCEVYHTLANILKKSGKSAGVGDEGGFAPDLDSDEQAIELILEAVNAAGYSDKTVKIALDAAASEWYRDGKYILPKRKTELSSSELCSYFDELTAKYPIVSLEDPLSEDDWESFSQFTAKTCDRLQVIGDDLFVTNTDRLKKGIELKSANSVLVKVNQIGTLTETFSTIQMAHRAGFTTVISHRSGETEDTTIADLAVAVNAGQIKTGAPCRSERTAKYNRLLAIEQELGALAQYSNPFSSKQ